MGPHQLPGPELVKDVGLVGYLLVLCLMSLLGGLAIATKRILGAIDRIAEAVEKSSPTLQSMKELQQARFDALDTRLIEIGRDAAESVEIARMWLATEAKERVVRMEPARKP